MLSVQTKELSIKEEKLLSVKEAAEYIEEGPGLYETGYEN